MCKLFVMKLLTAAEAVLGACPDEISTEHDYWRARLHLTGFAIPTDAFRVASDPRQERRTGELLNKSGASTSADDEPKIDQLSPSSHRQRPVNMTSESGLRR